MDNDSDTIAAIATASGRGGIGIVRISGPLSNRIAKQFCKQLPAPRVSTLINITDKDSRLIDTALIVFFPAPNSFTGESVLEIHGHGGAMVLDQILMRVIELGARIARPGEFSKRAFLNDKIDLAQAEAIADLIDASSHKAARAAVRSLEGQFSAKINALLAELIELRIYVESAIDFPEEEIDFISEGQVGKKTKELLKQVKTLIENATQGKLLRDGMTIVIAGKPNAGKSSLLNALSGAQTAIVTEIPGTTRDLLKETISIDGLPLNIVDTAGLRDSDDPVEQEGIRRARNQIENADCILNVIDLTDRSHDSSDVIKASKNIPVINVFNKIDLSRQDPPGIETKDKQKSVFLSAKTGEGLAQLRAALKNLVGYDSGSEGVFIARRRHLDALNRVQQNITNGLNAIDKAQAAELLAEDLLHAQHALSEITGEFSSDDLLGKIFSSFCIGK